jgi:hypothetical protein
LTEAAAFEDVRAPPIRKISLRLHSLANVIAERQKHGLDGVIGIQWTA